MSSTVTVKLPKKEAERLTKIALNYGLSLPEFSRYVLENISTGIPEESFNNYKNPKKMRESFSRALKDYETGKVHTRL
jgi:hypothetical protein